MFRKLDRGGYDPSHGFSNYNYGQCCPLGSSCLNHDGFLLIIDMCWHIFDPIYVYGHMDQFLFFPIESWDFVQVGKLSDEDGGACENY